MQAEETRTTGTSAMTVAVVIPAVNEEESIPLVLQDLPRDLVKHVVVVDNGSTDRTAEIAKQCGAEVVLEPQRGYGSACLAGIRHLPPDIDVVVFLDGDHSDFAEDLEIVLRPIVTAGADLVIGSRTRMRQARAALTAQQRWGNWLATRLMRFCWGCRDTDLGPFRAIRRNALHILSMTDRNFGWTVEMQIKAATARLQTVEVPVRYRARAAGRSKVSGTLTGGVLAGAKILYTIMRYAWLTRGGRRRQRGERP